MKLNMSSIYLTLVMKLKSQDFFKLLLPEDMTDSLEET